MSDKFDEFPESSKLSKISRAALGLAGAIPYAGSFLSTAASSWSEHEQDKVNSFFRYWLQMLREELGEKEKTIMGF